MSARNVMFYILLAEIKPDKKNPKIYKTNTHVILNDEVDCFLCSKVKIKIHTTSKSSLKKKKKVRVRVTFTNKTFINSKVERSYSGRFCT